MTKVLRQVQEVLSRGDSKSEGKVCSLTELQEIPAWVLLGEPGSGKTFSFTEEAQACGGLCLTISEFLHTGIDDHWKNKTLFLDGLDEIRASGESSVLLRVKTKLKEIGSPFFRLSCRSADWFGQSDREAISNTSPNKALSVFNLLPLSKDDILTLLPFFKVSDPEKFMNQARSHDVDTLCSNPHMLKMLAEVWTNSSWPETKKEIFELFCEAQAKEPNKDHRNQVRHSSISADAILDASGYLFATMLLGDKSGIALDETKKNDRYPTLDLYKHPDQPTASIALKRAIFTPSASEEQLEPSHRSIAEYLGARWLAKEIDKNGLPLSRVLQVMLGYDHKTVASLRGLYAWLAVYSQTARYRLIEMDPITVLIYGDVQSMDWTDKKLILHGIKKEIQTQGTPLLWDLFSIKTLKNLYTKEMDLEFLEMLQSELREDPFQAYISILLKSMENAPLSKELASQLQDVAADESRWEIVRKEAVRRWIDQESTTITDKKKFLDLIQNGNIHDHNDELAGCILMQVYPHIEPKEFLQYLHPPKRYGAYKQALIAWSEHISNEHLPTILDHLTTHTDLLLFDKFDRFMPKLIGTFLVRGIEIYGESISDEQLFSWLSMDIDQYGKNRRGNDQNEFLRTWLNHHPERYKGLLKLCFSSCEHSDNSLQCLYRQEQVLLRVSPPKDIGLWHFQQIDLTSNNSLAKAHFAKAMQKLSQTSHQGLTLEMIKGWAKTDSSKQDWLDNFLDPKSDDETKKWEKDYEDQNSQYQAESSKKRQERTINLALQLENIKTDRANPGLLHELAGVWKNEYTEIEGETPLDRFKSYCNNFDEVYTAAEAGFLKCIERTDLPSVSDIIDLYLKQKEHYIRKPCLLGMDLLTQNTMKPLDLLNEDILKRMICFKLTCSPEEPEWFIYLVEHKSTLISEIFFDYASAALKAKKEHINGIHILLDDPKYQKVAKIVIPKLLNIFPPLSKTSNLEYLECLLKAGLKYELEIQSIIEKKIALKRIDASQKIYWLISGMFLAPETYEKPLWDYLGNIWQRIKLFSDFIENRMSHIYLGHKLTPYTLGKLIELLTPNAQLDWPIGGGTVTDSMRLGDQVRALISKLAGLSNKESLVELTRLISLPATQKIRNYLDNAKRELIQRIREKEFSFPSLTDVTQILKNDAPVGPADLTELALVHLDEIATKIRGSSHDLFRKFWNEDTKKPKAENSCRDAILEMLENALLPFEIDCREEVNYVNDKRADMRLAFKNKFELPIEVKGEWHPELWTSINTQLINYYTKSKSTEGFGIYLVLWFGGNLQKPAKDGGKKPVTPNELRNRLSAMVPQEKQGQIHVRVVDVSWPDSK